MKILETKKVVSADYDWLPLIGSWLSEKLGRVEYLWVYEVNLGENGEIRMVTMDDLGSKKEEIVGQLAKQLIMSNTSQTKTVEVKGHTIYINSTIKKWTS